VIPSTITLREGALCSICFEDLVVGETETVMPCLGRHAYHCACIRKWFARGKKSCPNCRATVSPTHRTLAWEMGAPHTPRTPHDDLFDVLYSDSDDSLD